MKHAMETASFSGMSQVLFHSKTGTPLATPCSSPALGELRLLEDSCDKLVRYPGPLCVAFLASDGF